MSSGLRVQLASFNANLQGTATTRPDLTPWLVPTVSQGQHANSSTSSSKTPLPSELYLSKNPSTQSTHPTLPREAPDFYAVAFQELVPLHMGFAASADAAMYNVDLDIRRTIRPHQAVVSGNGMYAPHEYAGGPESYALLCRVDLVSIALFVYARERPPYQGSRKSAAARVKEIRRATVGTGLAGVMGNKGGVGARILVESADGKAPDEVLTFVSAHLAAHDHNVPRRNSDWRQIVERMVFSPSTASKLPILQQPLTKPPTLTNLDSLKEQYTRSQETIKASAPKLPVALDDKSYTIYDTTHLFVLGDLNHRIGLGPSQVSPSSLGSEKSSGSLTKSQLATTLESGDWKSLQAYEQLTNQRLASPAKAFHGLTELSLEEMNIPPTYKYKVVREDKSKSKGKGDGVKAGGQELSKKRIPGWTDRILWASAPGAQEQPFDRQGVKVEFFRSIMEFVHSDHKPVTTLLHLPAPKASSSNLSALNPYVPQPAFKRQTLALVGMTLDRIVGYIWSAIILLGGGSLVGGVIELAVLGGIAAWWLSRGGVGAGGDLNWRLFLSRQ